MKSRANYLTEIRRELVGLDSLDWASIRRVGRIAEGGRCSIKSINEAKQNVNIVTFVRIEEELLKLRSDRLLPDYHVG